jgi:pilus assembly protein CpaF
MSLYKRLHDVQSDNAPAEAAPPAAPAPAGGAGGSQTPPTGLAAAQAAKAGGGGFAGRRDPVLDELRQRIHHSLIEELGPILYDSRLSEEDLRKKVHEQLHAALAQERAPLSASDKAQLIQDVSDDILGYGPIDPLLRDDDVSEIMCNGPDSIYVERSGKLTKDPITFVDEAHLRRIIDKIVGQVGRRIDESTPMCDARLPDGSRVNAIISPLTIGGPFLTIRKFKADPLQVDDLIRFGTFDANAARFLQACVVGRLNMIVSGGTGTGKTTTLNVLSSFIPTDERIVTVEDAKELQLHQDHVLCMETRPPNIEGRGAVTIRDLVKNSLRMRPDRIVVGECRAGEALDMLQAMNTGHDGSLTTVHANTPRDTLSRLETLTLMSGFDLPVRAIREQMASAIDVIIQIARLRDGSRRVTHITEVQGMEGDVITLQDIFLFDFSAGVDDNGRYRGVLKPTGIRPKFAEKLTAEGIRLGPETFQPNGGGMVTQ